MIFVTSRRRRNDLVLRELIMAGVFLRCSRNRNFSARKQFFGFHKFSCFLEPVPIINIFWRYPRCLRTRGIDKLLCILPSYPRKSGTAFLLSLFFYPCLYRSFQPSSHIGLSVSREAHRIIWPKVREWVVRTE